MKVLNVTKATFSQPAGLRLQERMQRATELWQHRIQSKREKPSVTGEGTWGELNKVDLLQFTSRLGPEISLKFVLYKLSCFSA